MRRIMQRNQVVITALAVMLAVAGYLTYAGKQDLENLNQAQSGLVSESGPDYDTYVAGTGESRTPSASSECSRRYWFSGMPISVISVFILSVG